MPYVDFIINRDEVGPSFSAIGDVSVLVYGLRNGKIYVYVKFRRSKAGVVGWIDCPVAEITEDSFVHLLFPEDQVQIRACGYHNNDGVYVRLSHN